MANITIQRDPACITNAERHQFNGSLIEWLTANEQFNFGGLHAYITLNGRTIINTAEMTPEQCDDAAQTVVGEGDNVLIIVRPQGLDPFTLAVIVFVAAVAVSYIAFSQLIPNLKQDQGEGPGSNNQLNSASNDYRPWGAVADIAGQVISYPDFIQPSYFEYVSNQRVFREIFCIGVGQYVVEDVKEGDTPFSQIQPYSFTVYSPGETPADLKNVRTNQQSVDYDMLPPDKSAVDIAFADDGSILSPSTINVPLGLVADLRLEVGSTVALRAEWKGPPGEPNFSIDGVFTVSSFDSGSITFVELLSATSVPKLFFCQIINQSLTVPLPWFFLEGDEISEVWFNLSMPQGLRKGDGTEQSVSAVLIAEPIDEFGEPTGPQIQRGAIFTGNTLSPLRQTFKITSDTDGLVPGRYRARALRITNSLGNNAVDLLTLEGVSSVTPYTANFGNVTLLEVTRRSTERANRGASKKINAKVTRKLQTFTSGGAFVPTRRFCDYVFYVLHEQMQVPIVNINTEQLFGIHDNLSDAQLGLFDYSFDDKNTEARERIKAACNAARVAAWEDGQVWSFVRDEAKPVSVAHFDRRNTIGGQAQYEHSFRLPSDYDSVSLRYVDPGKNVQKVISKRINSAGVIVDGAGSRPLEFELIGCRNLMQAMNRLNLEIRRLIYQRVQVTDTVIMDALTVGKWQRVSWSDVWDGQTFDGEILDVVGNVYSTSERFEPESGFEYWVYITDVNGNPSNTVRAYPRADGNIYGFEATGLTGAYLKTGTQQLGSRYFIATTADMTNSLFLLDGRGRPNERGETSVTLIEYNQAMYEAD